jgi:4-hydroxysphinganine ceramide fatty acyl 2-hydroxylase
MAGFLTGYVMYDMTHYFIHHNKPALSYWRDLKDYHILHHYKNPKLGFGVSNKIWDYAFDTVLYAEDKQKSE